MLRKRISPLDAHLGYWLRFVSNHVSQAFGVKVASRGVTVAEWVLLRELYEHEVAAPSALADGLGMTRGTVSKLVERLCLKRLVRRTQGEGDRRFQALELTAEGRKLVPELAALADQNDAEFFGHFTAAERERFEGVLRDLVQRRKLTAVPIE
jgi:DNA-binding MarR family transcriptional regulator